MIDRETLAIAMVAIPALTLGKVWLLPARWVRTVVAGSALVTAGLAIAVAARTLIDAEHPRVDDWIALDAAAGLLIGVIGGVGLVSVLTSPAYLRSTFGDDVGARRTRTYYSVLYAFWAVLLAVPLSGNLGVAWLLIEATTAASAFLVGFNGKPRALEAGWKYLILTSLGLGVALLGMVLLAAGLPSGSLTNLAWGSLQAFSSGEPAGLVAYLLLMAGLAAKIGWAPVHNWLPDAHSEAPAPISSMLSSALLPAVVLVAWRCEQGFAPVIGDASARGVLIAFGIASIAVAVPFLARLQTWKRLLAYSSLEHMGVIALGIGFATPLALIGVALHIVGHAIAKTLGFSAATPLLAARPLSAHEAVSGIVHSDKRLALPMALALGALSGLPPLPLFISEAFIIAGGIQSGHLWIASAAAVLLALAFLGLTHSLFETMGGQVESAQPAGSEPGSASHAVYPHGLASVRVLALVSVVLLLILSAGSVWLIGTPLSQALMAGV